MNAGVNLNRNLYWS